MKSYSFRLNKILDYRKYLRKRAQIDVFNARIECQKKEKELLGLVDQRAEISEECSEEETKGMSVPVYQIFQSFMKKIDYDLKDAHLKLNEEKEKVMVKEAILKLASIKKKTLETLKDLQYKKYMETMRREEQKILDEIVITGKGRSV
ncbi:MAG: flagellar export protein FliJ [Desulfobacterales bacterium]|nr:flagellar export protein FliJ [Desulfobacterales bacterium]